MTRRDLTAETAEDKFDVEAEARRRGVQPYQVRAMQAVPDRLIADLVSFSAVRSVSPVRCSRLLANRQSRRAPVGSKLLRSRLRTRVSLVTPMIFGKILNATNTHPAVSTQLVSTRP
jgi:hypothetical protein